MLNVALNIIVLAAKLWNFQHFLTSTVLNCSTGYLLRNRNSGSGKKRFVSRSRMAQTEDPSLTHTEEECVLPLFHGIAALMILTFRYQIDKRYWHMNVHCHGAKPDVYSHETSGT